MKFRPCIDLHNGRVRQIVGSTLTDEGEGTKVNFTAAQDAAFFARTFAAENLSGGHIIILNPVTHPYYEATRDEAVKALKEAPGRWQIGGGITPENAAFFLDAGASHVIVTSYVFRNGRIDMPRLEKMKESATNMRAEGWSDETIAKILRVDVADVRIWLDSDAE